MPTTKKKTPELIAWLGPLLAEVKARGLSAAKQKEQAGGLGPFDYELYGQLLIKLLGWEDSYPKEPPKSL